MARTSGLPSAEEEQAERATRAALKKLPAYFTVKDLLEVLGSKDALLDAYVLGWLPQVAEATLEGDFPRLQCWLLARLLRLAVEDPPNPLTPE